MIKFPSNMGITRALLRSGIVRSLFVVYSCRYEQYPNKHRISTELYPN